MNDLDRSNLAVIRRRLDDVVYADYFDPVKAYFAMLDSIDMLSKMIERNKKK